MAKKTIEDARSEFVTAAHTGGLHIMLALARGGSHGYGIMLEVDRLTSGQMKIGPGTLYRSIQRMLIDRLDRGNQAFERLRRRRWRGRYYR